MTTASWASKLPADMSNEELQDAKTAVYGALQPAQENINVLSAAVQHLDLEINTRYKMGNYQQVAATALPEYPLDALQTSL